MTASTQPTGSALHVTQIFIRQFSYYFLIYFVFALFSLPMQLAGENIATLLIYLVLLVSYSLFLVIHFIVRTTKREKVYFYELLSKTYVVSSL